MRIEADLDSQSRDVVGSYLRSSSMFSVVVVNRPSHGGDPCVCIGMPIRYVASQRRFGSSLHVMHPTNSKSSVWMRMASLHLQPRPPLPDTLALSQLWENPVVVRYTGAFEAAAIWRTYSGRASKSCRSSTHTDVRVPYSDMLSMSSGMGSNTLPPRTIKPYRSPVSRAYVSTIFVSLAARNANLPIPFWPLSRPSRLPDLPRTVYTSRNTATAMPSVSTSWTSTVRASLLRMTCTCAASRPFARACRTCRSALFMSSRTNAPKYSYRSGATSRMRESISMPRWTLPSLPARPDMALRQSPSPSPPPDRALYLLPTSIRRT